MPYKGKLTQADKTKKYSSKQVMEVLGIGRSTLYQLMIRAKTEPEKRMTGGGIIFNFYSAEDIAVMKSIIDPRKTLKSQKKMKYAMERATKEADKEEPGKPISELVEKGEI